MCVFTVSQPNTIEYSIADSVTFITTPVAMVVPMIAAESLSTEFDKIKAILHDMLFNFNDENRVYFSAN